MAESPRQILRFTILADLLVSFVVLVISLHGLGSRVFQANWPRYRWLRFKPQQMREFEQTSL